MPVSCQEPFFIFQSFFLHCRPVSLFFCFSLFLFFFPSNYGQKSMGCGHGVSGQIAQHQAGMSLQATSMNLNYVWVSNLNLNPFEIPRKLFVTSKLSQSEPTCSKSKGSNLKLEDCWQATNTNAPSQGKTNQTHTHTSAAVIEYMYVCVCVIERLLRNALSAVVAAANRKWIPRDRK